MDYADAEVGDLPDHIRESLRVQPAPQAGEQKRRPHKEDLYTPGKTFGKATPSYKDGRGTRDTLKWGADDETPTTQHRADFSHGSLDKTQLASRTARGCGLGDGGACFFVAFVSDIGSTAVAKCSSRRLAV